MHTPEFLVGQIHFKHCTHASPSPVVMVGHVFFCGDKLGSGRVGLTLACLNTARVAMVLAHRPGLRPRWTGEVLHVAP